MITANELRIGNYIKYKGKIISAAPKLIYDLFYTGEYTGKHEAIELTSEILEKAGFVKMGDGVYSSGTVLIRHFVMSFAKVDYDKDGTRHFTTYISYVHQLQNLYYALTGEELEIEL